MNKVKCQLLKIPGPIWERKERANFKRKMKGLDPYTTLQLVDKGITVAEMEMKPTKSENA